MRAVMSESTVREERAEFPESTEDRERAATRESTDQPERAVPGESTAIKERAVVDVSTEESERAVVRESTDDPERARPLPVIEVFGPTIAGEGSMAGLPTHFVRLGLCDYRCEWCDSLHAVLPEQVKANAEYLDVAGIVSRVEALGPGAEWVTLSGGNPAVHDLSELLVALCPRYRVTVETQGGRWRDWLADVDCLTISPKPPSSGMSAKVEKDLDAFMLLATTRRVPRRRDCLKVVIFDEADYQFARDVFFRFPAWPRYLSSGTRSIEQESLAETAERYRWLCERLAADPDLNDARAFPQLHVLAWAHARGV